MRCRPTSCPLAAASAPPTTFKMHTISRAAVGCMGMFGAPAVVGYERAECIDDPLFLRPIYSFSSRRAATASGMIIIAS